MLILTIRSFPGGSCSMIDKELGCYFLCEFLLAVVECYSGIQHIAIEKVPLLVVLLARLFYFLTWRL